MTGLGSLLTGVVRLTENLGLEFKLSLAFAACHRSQGGGLEEYFDVISALMHHDPRFETLPPPAERQPAHDMDYRTSFERKKRQIGQTIHRGRWKLRES